MDNKGVAIANISKIFSQLEKTSGDPFDDAHRLNNPAPFTFHTSKMINVMIMRLRMGICDGTLVYGAR